MSTASVGPPAASGGPDYLEELRKSGVLVIVVGAISMVAGVLALAYPDITLTALAILAGINLILFGIWAMVDAFGRHGDGSGTGVHVLAGILGLLALIAGLVVLRQPGKSLLAVIVVLGVWFVVRGIVDLVMALVVPGDRMWRLLGAGIDIVLGILILSLPKLSLGGLALLVGLAFLFRGGLMVWSGFSLRRAAQAAAKSPTS
jgi:uncharacterized membrane protein HdeD (DUF308 family)